MSKQKTIALYVLLHGGIFYSMQDNKQSLQTLQQKVTRREYTIKDPHTGLNYNPETGKVYHDKAISGQKIDNLCKETAFIATGCCISMGGCCISSLPLSTLGAGIIARSAIEWAKNALELKQYDRYLKVTLELEKELQKQIKKEQ